MSTCIYEASLLYLDTLMALYHIKSLAMKENDSMCNIFRTIATYRALFMHKGLLKINGLIILFDLY